MLYALSDIHGHLDIFKAALEKIDLSGENKLILLGDYIDQGPQSGGTLRYIYGLQQEQGADKVIVLRGNHEEMLLGWLDAYCGANAGKQDEYGLTPYDPWLETDTNYAAFRTLITQRQWQDFTKLPGKPSDDKLNIEAAKMVLETCGQLIKWLRGLPYYYETEKQIFVHAGVDEEAEEWWHLGTPEYVFTGKFPATKGSFYKDIIAGHIGTYSIAEDPHFHGVYHDGQSHYYIDGTVCVSGKIPILAYDEKSGEYSQL